MQVDAQSVGKKYTVSMWYKDIVETADLDG